MPRKRRLQGIAALSAVTLATAGFSGVATAAEECADTACADEQVSLTDLIGALSGDEIPEDALLKIEKFYEQLGMGDLAEAFMKVEYDGSSPEEALLKFADVYEQLGMGDLGEAFVKVEFDSSSPEEAFPKVEDALIKIDGLEGLEGLEGLIPEDALVEMQDALPLIEEALLKMGDSGEIDPAMLKMFLDMIPEDE